MTKPISSVSDLFGYIRNEILYLHRRYWETDDDYEELRFITAWRVYYTIGTDIGMSNLPEPGSAIPKNF